MLEPDILKAIDIHEKVIGKNLLRGTDGRNLLDSALKAAFQSFAGQECYPDPMDKAVRLLVGVIKNHPFIDGNKRTAFVLFKELLREYSYTVKGYENKEVINLLEKIAGFQEELDSLCDSAKEFFNKWLMYVEN